MCHCPGASQPLPGAFCCSRERSGAALDANDLLISASTGNPSEGSPHTHSVGVWALGKTHGSEQAWSLRRESLLDFERSAFPPQPSEIRGPRPVVRRRAARGLPRPPFCRAAGKGPGRPGRSRSMTQNGCSGSLVQGYDFRFGCERYGFKSRTSPSLFLGTRRWILGTRGATLPCTGDQG